MRIASLHGRRSRGAKSSRVRTVAIIAAGLLMASAIAIPAMAEHTRWWRQSSFEEFDKGTAKGVALRSDGKLFLAPRFAEFADSNLAYLLAMRADSKGNLYAAGGSNAKVVRLDPSGKTTTVFESTELAAQTLALDPAGNLYVGTSPDGKVYKVTPTGQSSVFFDPKTKYIWDLAIDRDGTLYVATGDTGKIFAVAPDGKGQIFYTSQETHVRSLALDSNGNLLAGTEPSGLVLRISRAVDASTQKTAPAGRSSNSATNPRRAFVLYETAKKEITALLLDANGNLYVAGVGEKLPPSLRQPRVQAAEQAPSGGFTVTLGPAANTAIPLPQTQAVTPFAPLPTVNSSSVYRIAPDGSPEELWSSPDEVVYALGRLPSGKLLLGTGNQGAVLELEENHIFSRLVKTPSGQVTSIATGPGGKLFLAAANPGKLFTLGPDTELEGTFESQPFDAHIFSRWGRLEWWGQTGAPAKNAGSARIEFHARSGNTSDPESTWSAWSGPYSNAAGDKLDIPAARFVQWKAVLHGAAGGPVPEIDWVSVAYLPKNVPPNVTAIALQSPGIRVQGISIPGLGAPSQTPVQLRMPQPAAPPSAFNSAFSAAAITSLGTSTSTTRFDAVPQGLSQKGYQSVLWTAEDANDDQIEFSVYFRGENETTWKLLKDKLDTRFYSWDTTTMPDGAYYLKIVATDAHSNPSGEALTSDRESDRFEVDNTPPAIGQLTADPVTGGASARVRFQSSDPGSLIARAQYSLDAGTWTTVFPVGGLSDAPQENYDFSLLDAGPGEHTVTVRVYDQFENVSSAKATFRIPASGK
jgi:sugar lactone lactonase YvrE